MKSLNIFFPFQIKLNKLINEDGDGKKQYKFISSTDRCTGENERRQIR